MNIWFFKKVSAFSYFMTLVLIMSSLWSIFDLSKYPSQQIAHAAAAQLLDCDATGIIATSTTWVDVCEISAISFTANKKYLIYANAYVSNTDNTTYAGIRLVYGSTPTVFTDATATYELTDVGSGGGQRTNYGYFTVYTQGATPDLIKLQINNSSTDTTTAHIGQIFALKLSDDFVENTDYCYAEQTTDYTTEDNFSDTSSTDAASCALTANGSDDYLAFASAVVKMTSASRSYSMSLHESVEDVDSPIYEYEGEDYTNEIRGHTIGHTYLAPSAASHTWQPRFLDETTAYTVLSSRIFVINLDLFAQHDSAFTAAEDPPDSTPPWKAAHIVQSVTVTPDITGKWFIFGSLGWDMNDQNLGWIRTRLYPGGLYDGLEVPNYDGWDDTDVSHVNLFDNVTLNVDFEKTITLDVYGRTLGGGYTQDHHLVAFSLELFSDDPYSPEMNNWRWYADEADAAVDVPYANENTAPPQIENGKSIPYKLRVNLTETAGIAENDSRKILQWSTSPGGPWTALAATDSEDIGRIWQFYDGGGTDGATIPSKVLSDSSAASLGTHNEAVTGSQTNSDHPASTTVEWEFSFYNYNAAANTTYFFNIKDEVLGSDIPLAGLKTYPQLVTASSYDLSLETAPSAVYLGSWQIGSSAYHSYDFTSDEKIQLRDNRGQTAGSSSGWSLSADITTELSYEISPASCSAVVFTGSGVDDMSVSLCAFTGEVDADYKVEIDGNVGGVLDTFRWTDGSLPGWNVEDVPIEEAGNSLNNGIVILFDTINNHTLGDYWEFTAYAEDVATIPKADMYWITNTITGLYDAPITNIDNTSGNGYMGSAVTAVSVSGNAKDGLGGFKFQPTMRIYNVSTSGDYIGGVITFTLA